MKKYKKCIDTLNSWLTDMELSDVRRNAEIMSLQLSSERQIAEIRSLNSSINSLEVSNERLDAEIRSMQLSSERLKLRVDKFEEKIKHLEEVEKNECKKLD